MCLCIHFLRLLGLMIAPERDRGEDTLQDIRTGPSHLRFQQFFYVIFIGLRLVVGH